MDPVMDMNAGQSQWFTLQGKIIKKRLRYKVSVHIA